MRSVLKRCSSRAFMATVMSWVMRSEMVKGEAPVVRLHQYRGRDAACCRMSPLPGAGPRVAHRPSGVRARNGFRVRLPAGRLRIDSTTLPTTQSRTQAGVHFRADPSISCWATIGHPASGRDLILVQRFIGFLFPFEECGEGLITHNLLHSLGALLWRLGQFAIDECVIKADAGGVGCGVCVIKLLWTSPIDESHAHWARLAA